MPASGSEEVTKKEGVLMPEKVRVSGAAPQLSTAVEGGIRQRWCWCPRTSRRVEDEPLDDLDGGRVRRRRSRKTTRSRTTRRRTDDSALAGTELLPDDAAVVAVEAGALEHDAHGVEDLAQRALAVRAHGQRVVGEALAHLEGLATVGALVLVRRHGWSLQAAGTPTTRLLIMRQRPEVFQLKPATDCSALTPHCEVPAAGDHVAHLDRVHGRVLEQSFELRLAPPRLRDHSVQHLAGASYGRSTACRSRKSSGKTSAAGTGQSVVCTNTGPTSAYGPPAVIGRCDTRAIWSPARASVRQQRSGSPPPARQGKRQRFRNRHDRCIGSGPARRPGRGGTPTLRSCPLERRATQSCEGPHLGRAGVILYGWVRASPASSRHHQRNRPHHRPPGDRGNRRFRRPPLVPVVRRNDRAVRPGR